MLFIKNLLFEAKLLGDQSSAHSIACISTSRPIYLVFDQNSGYPIYVIRKIADAATLHSHKIHNQLYQLAGNLVPEPVGVYEYAGEKYDIQRGVNGSPWFQLKSIVRTAEAKAHLEKRMWQALRDFQAAIYSGNSSATNNVEPSEELRKASIDYQDTGVIMSTELKKLIDDAISDLSQTPRCPSIPQHGDFCLNNLIIDTNQVTVIDFEDFSITNMPMYDHFTLALSLPSFSGESASAINVCGQEVIVSTAGTLNIPEKFIKWHFLHHLLLRLGNWSMGEKRKPYRAWLIQTLNYFIEEMTTPNR